MAARVPARKKRGPSMASPAATGSVTALRLGTRVTLLPLAVFGVAIAYGVTFLEHGMHGVE